tara:strand:- start:5547 stop:6932 length:1386 start_codon:yes stop_codon:yes gene_type:complete
MPKLNQIIEYGFYLFVFLLPWQTRLIWQDAYLNEYVWEYGRLSLYGTEILLWLVLLVFSIWLFKNRPLKKINLSQFFNRLKEPAILIYWLVILFILISGISIFWSLDASLAYYNWFIMLEAGAMLAMIVTFTTGDSSSSQQAKQQSGFKLRKIAVVWVSSAVIQSIFAIWQFFAQYTFANKWLGLAYHHPTVGGSIILQTFNERWLRAYGSLPHPNILAGFLVIAIIFILYLSFIAKKRNQRIFVLASLVMIIPALFFTFSRSAWLALIVSLGILIFWLIKDKHYLWKKTFFKILLLVIIIFSILGFSMSEPVLTRLTGDQDLEVASIYLRVAFAQQAWDIISNAPLQGVGVGNYTLGVFQQINDTWPGYYYQPVHNIILLILAEVGIFGLLVFLIMIGLLTWFLEISPTSLEKMISFLPLVAILTISLFDHYFWSLYSGAIIFWLILALNIKQLSIASDS